MHQGTSMTQGGLRPAIMARIAYKRMPSRLNCTLHKCHPQLVLLSLLCNAPLAAMYTAWLATAYAPKRHALRPLATPVPPNDAQTVLCCLWLCSHCRCGD
jgi:hypothetical protein